MKVQLIPITEIRKDGGTQLRVSLTESAVEEYQQAYLDSEDVPPLVVFQEPGYPYWLADGFHRFEAMSRMGWERLPCNVRKGQRRDAVLWAAQANKRHGLKPSAEDKRKTVKVLLEDEEWSGWSDREISRHCGVSAPFVAKLRGELSVNVYRSQPRKVRRGEQEYVQNTGNIGKKKEAKPEAPPVDLGPPLPDADLRRLSRFFRRVQEILVAGAPWDGVPGGYEGCPGCCEQVPQHLASDHPCARWQSAFASYLADKSLGDPLPPSAPEPATMETEEEGEGEEVEEPASPDTRHPTLRSGYVHWNTPPEVLDVVREMGKIALDPCSNPWSMVDARETMESGEDGLSYSWEETVKSGEGGGLVFVNPPFGAQATPPWISKCVEEAKSGVEIVLLVPARTDLPWFQDEVWSASAICLWRSRICFWKEGEPGPHTSTFPSILAYWGPRPWRFADVFRPKGRVFCPRQGEMFGEEELKPRPSPSRGLLASGPKRREAEENTPGVSDQEAISHLDPADVPYFMSALRRIAREIPTRTPGGRQACFCPLCKLNLCEIEAWETHDCALARVCREKLKGEQERRAS